MSLFPQPLEPEVLLPEHPDEDGGRHLKWKLYFAVLYFEHETCGYVIRHQWEIVPDAAFPPLPIGSTRDQ